MSKKEYEKALETWLLKADFTPKFTNEFGCVCNEIIFTSKNGNKLCLTLFDVKPLNGDNLDISYYKAAEETLLGVPSGFPTIYSVMYTNEAAKISGVDD